MSSKIRVLCEHTINKIAAGEVIENPSSVVKELVENALDAGSTAISIEIRGGGRQLIRVTDNGCGMSSDDALLCLERHATSKLKEIEDVWALDTMGFRGEAIASIAAISKFTLLTRPNETHDHAVGQQGTMVSVEGGKVIQCCPVECAMGTSIEVKSLFFNIPVRKKFQRSPVYDTTEIQRVITLQALANPQVQFTLISNEEKLIGTQCLPSDTPFEEHLRHRIAQVLGPDFAKQLCYVQGQLEQCELRGFIGLPHFNKHNRTEQYLLINRRAVVSPLISYFVREGYGTTMPSGRHSIYILHLNMPPDWIDVNVHPQKREVRLRQEQLLKCTIRTAIEQGLQKNTFGTAPIGGAIGFGAKITSSLPSEFNFIEAPAPINKNNAFFDRQDSENRFEQSEAVQQSLSSNELSQIEKSAYQAFPTSNAGAFDLFEPKPFAPATEPAHDPNPNPMRNDDPLLFTTANPNNEQPNVVAAIPKFLIAKLPHPEQKEGAWLWLIDQRAAHERIIFEQLQRKREDALEIQTFLLPYTLQFTSVQASILRNHMSLLHQYGIQIKEFSANTFVIDGLPTLFGNVDIHKFVDEMIQHLQEMGHNEEAIAQQCERKLAAIASRTAISSERTLSLAEGQALLKQLLACSSPYHCPTGKPTLVPLTLAQVSALFSR